MSTYPIVCEHCGYQLGDVFEAYKKLLKLRLDELPEGENLNNSLMFNFDTEMNMNDVLNALQIKSPCCRTVCTTRIVGSNY